MLIDIPVLKRALDRYYDDRLAREWPAPTECEEAKEEEANAEAT